MPTKPKVPCKHPGCPELVPSGAKYCERHREIPPEETRSATCRGYTAAWRKAFLQHVQPLCQNFLKEGRYTEAPIADHVIPHQGDPELFWDRSNWQGLCKHHHDVKTRREDQYPVYHY